MVPLRLHRLGQVKLQIHRLQSSEAGNTNLLEVGACLIQPHTSSMDIRLVLTKGEGETDLVGRGFLAYRISLIKGGGTRGFGA